MKKSKYTEEQIIGTLKQMEAGRRAEDVAREVGVSKHTLYAWKAKYGGMDASQAQEALKLSGTIQQSAAISQAAQLAKSPGGVMSLYNALMQQNASASVTFSVSAAGSSLTYPGSLSTNA